MLVHSSRHDASALSPQAAPSPQDNPSSQRQPLKLKDSSKPQNFSSPQPFLPFYLFTFLPLKDSSQARSFFTFFTF